MIFWTSPSDRPCPCMVVGISLFVPRETWSSEDDDKPQQVGEPLVPMAGRRLQGLRTQLMAPNSRRLSVPECNTKIYKIYNVLEGNSSEFSSFLILKYMCRQRQRYIIIVTFFRRFVFTTSETATRPDSCSSCWLLSQQPNVLLKSRGDPAFFHLCLSLFPRLPTLEPTWCPLLRSFSLLQKSSPHSLNTLRSFFFTKCALLAL